MNNIQINLDTMRTPSRNYSDEAEQFYNRIVKAYAGKCINEIPNDTESSSQRLQVPGLSTAEDYHTSPNSSEGEISINAVLNNFALQICHSLNITNERSSGTDVRESDTRKPDCNFTDPFSGSTR